jgi:GH24 family phage-related lysozyme (muramidase)
MKLRNLWLTAAFIASAILIGCKDDPAADAANPPPSNVVNTVVSAVTTTVEKAVAPPTTAFPSFQLSQAAEDLVTDAEVSANSVEGHKYYDKHYQTATFAGSGSGPTIGIGVDLGMNSSQFTTSCWSPFFSGGIVARFASCHGHTTTALAKRDIADMQDIVVVWSTALQEFNANEVANYYQLTLRTYPGLSQLSKNAQSAVVSLTYNRGSSMIGDSRVDMRTLRDAVTAGDLQAMANAVRHMIITMEAAWKSEGIYDGMVNRRNAEARLILQPDS